MVLRYWGEVDFTALCEPALLTTPQRVGEAPAVLVEATTGIVEAGADERRSEEFRALRNGLAMLRMTNKRSGSTRAATSTYTLDDHVRADPGELLNFRHATSCDRFST